VCNVEPRAGVWKKRQDKTPELRFHGVWCLVSFLLFLVEPSFDTRSQTQDELYN